MRDIIYVPVLYAKVNVYVGVTHVHANGHWRRRVRDNPVSAFPHSLMVCVNIQLGLTPLHFASDEGHCDCAALLLGGKADPNHRDEVTRGARAVLGPVFAVRFRVCGTLNACT